ncbi:MAG: hypothetical protein U5R31_07590 [Acidimicrobiia bacterium]|nr:hypothetical protein [Acidimicrobiia bacterium]
MAWRARLVPGVLAGNQRARQPDYFGSVARIAQNLVLPDGLLDVDDSGFRWSALDNERIREIAASWADVRRVETQRLDRRHHGLTIHLRDGSRIGLVLDADPRLIPGFDRARSE